MREQRRVSVEAVADCFKGFETYGEPRLERMLRESARFASAMSSADHPAYWLSLLGPSGTGKSMLAKGLSKLFSRHLDDLPDEILNSRKIDRRLRAGGFLSWPKCIDCMLAGDFGFMRQACEDWFLVLDDVGAEHERLRDLSAAKLFAILNARQYRFTVLTANLGIEEIAEKLDTRISSRLLRHGGTVIDTTGTSDHALRGRRAA